MRDTTQERDMEDADRIARVVARLREVQTMTPEQQAQWRADCAERERVCQFCKKHPEQCKP